MLGNGCGAVRLSVPVGEVRGQRVAWVWRWRTGYPEPVADVLQRARRAAVRLAVPGEDQQPWRRLGGASHEIHDADVRVAERHQGIGAGGCGSARLAADVAARQVRWPGRLMPACGAAGADDECQTLPVRLVVMQDRDPIHVLPLRVLHERSRLNVVVGTEVQEVAPAGRVQALRMARQRAHLARQSDIRA